MKIIHELTYPVYVEMDTIQSFKDIFLKHVTQTRAFVVTDEHVWKSHKDTFLMMTSFIEVEVIILTPGEKTKSINVFESTLEVLIQKGMKRDDILIAFGGGVIGDLTGYIASSVFRGVDIIHIPTTLIAQVDSSIGSKVGINLKSGKNLVGAFKDPLFVYTYTPFLNTLDTREFNNGMAEVIKAGAIYDETIIHDLIHGDFNEKVLLKAIQVKIDIVSKDKYEDQLRMILNFGHTLGHAIEKAHMYETIKHGEAISIGMKYALSLGESLGITHPDASKKVMILLEKYRLLTPLIKDVKHYIPWMKVDKKQRKDGLNFIFIKTLGNALIKRLDDEALYVI